MNLQELRDLPLIEAQQILLDQDFDDSRPTLIECWLERQRDMSELDNLGY